METMTSRERIRAVVEGRKPDRVPVICSAGGYAAKLCGLPLHEFYTNIEQCIRVQRLAADLHGYDDSPGYGWADWGAWEFGGALKFPDSYAENAPRTVTSPVESLSDVDKLRIPDPRTAGMYPLLMEFNRAVRALGMPARVPAGSASSAVAAIIGKDRLYRWYMREPEAVRTVYEKVVTFLLRAADMIIAEFGAENCSAYIGTPLDTNDLISPKIFEAFSLPCIKRVNSGLLDRGVKRFSVHICGNHRGNLPIMTEMPLPPRTTISIGSQLRILEVAEAFKHQHIIAGNVSTTILNLGTYEEVYEEARRCIEEGKDLPGGFMLQSACGLPVLTPPLNVHAMVKAAKELGKYG